MIILRYMAMTRAVLSMGLFICASITICAQSAIWKSNKGTLKIESDAPLELIRAKSDKVIGAIDPLSKSFAVTLNINSFVGFNSELQQTHFMENYMEQSKFPTAKFTGKIIEDIPFDQPGQYEVRAKGNLEIHGIVKERIIQGTLIIRNGIVQIQSSFLVPVSDHGINIPKIVSQKIAEQIRVNIEMEFSKDIKL